MFASDDGLGVKKPSRTTLRIACSPVGPYFPEGVEPMKLFLNEEVVRAWPGGMGEFKASGNYGITIQAQVEASTEYGCQQVLYTFPRSNQPGDRTIQEAGSMNFFILFQKADGTGLELVTPNLDGTILPGIGRDSILQLARGWQEFQVSERPVTVGELRQASEERRLLEMFGSGTACIVQPVNALLLKSGEELRTTVHNGGPSLASRVLQAMTDIQYARVESPWSVPID